VNPAAPPDPSVHGLSLSRWADVEAALAEGEPEGAALGALGWPKARYKRAATAWKARVVAEPPLLEAYGAHLAAAEDRRERGILPIAEELPSWVGFLKAYSAAGEPGPFLRNLGLRPPDLARLSRRWKRRLDAEPKLAEQAARLAAQEPPPALPPLVIGGAAALAPPGLSGKENPPPPSRREAAPWDVFRFATLAAELRVLAPQRADVLARHALSEEAIVSLEATFAARFAAEPLVAADFRRLVSHAEVRLRSVVARAAERGGPPSVRRPPPPPEAPWSRAIASRPPAALTETADLGSVLPRAAVPFAPSAEAARPPVPSRPAALGDKPALGTGTAFLPEARAAAPKPVTLPFRAPPHLTTTAPSLGPKGPALPFAEGKALPPSLSSRPPPPAEKPPSLGQTAPLRDAPKEALPFGKPKKSALARTNMNLAVPREMFAAKAPPKAPEPAPTPPLPLERHASLHAELATYPERRAAVLLRYQVDERALGEADRAFKQRFAEDPALHRRWHEAFTTYGAWLRGRR
jgi:hypothetical protein